MNDNNRRNSSYITFIRSVRREAASESGRRRRDTTEFRDRDAVLDLVAHRADEIDESRGDRIIESDAGFNGHGESHEEHGDRDLRHQASIAAHYAEPGIRDETIERCNGDT